LAQPQETHAVRGGVSYISNKGGNIGVLVNAAGSLMVDAQFADVAPENEAAVVALGGGGPVYLINTHWHPDHTGGNAHFASTAQIFAHLNVRRRLEGDSEIGGRVLNDTPRAALPVVLFKTGLKIYFGGEELHLIHAPRAHTDGDTIVYFKEARVIHMGDTYFSGGYPFIDISSGGSAQGLIDAVEGVISWAPEDAWVIPGHGQATDLRGLLAYLEMLKTIVARVRAGAARSLDLDALLAEGVTRDFDSQWGGGFIDARRLVESILADLPPSNETGQGAQDE
jgi:glyoxylase-like metal-dependent hydrolase (beta-lactamase superfamily II)